MVDTLVGVVGVAILVVLPVFAILCTQKPKKKRTNELEEVVDSPQKAVGMNANPLSRKHGGATHREASAVPMIGTEMPKVRINDTNDFRSDKDKLGDLATSLNQEFGNDPDAPRNRKFSVTRWMNGHAKWRTPAPPPPASTPTNDVGDDLKSPTKESQQWSEKQQSIQGKLFGNGGSNEAVPYIPSITMDEPEFQLLHHEVSKGTVEKFNSVKVEKILPRVMRPKGPNGQRRPSRVHRREPPKLGNTHETNEDDEPTQPTTPPTTASSTTTTNDTSATTTTIENEKQPPPPVLAKPTKKHSDVINDVEQHSSDNEPTLDDGYLHIPAKSPDPKVPPPTQIDGALSDTKQKRSSLALQLNGLLARGPPQLNQKKSQRSDLQDPTGPSSPPPPPPHQQQQQQQQQSMLQTALNNANTNTTNTATNDDNSDDHNDGEEEEEEDFSNATNHIHYFLASAPTSPTIKQHTETSGITSNTNTNTDTDTDTNTNINTDTNTDINTDTNTNANTDKDTNTNRNTDTNSNTDHNTVKPTDTNTDTNTNLNANKNTSTNATKTSNTHATTGYNTNGVLTKTQTQTQSQSQPQTQTQMQDDEETEEVVKGFTAEMYDMNEAIEL